MGTEEIKELVIKFLLNEASPDEQKLVTDWILRSKENKEEFLEIQALVDSIMAYKNPYRLDARKAYQQLRKKIESREVLIESPKTRKMPVFLKVASIFLAGFCFSWFMHALMSRPAKSGQMSLYQKIEVPYGSKSRLELPDGTKVVLNSGSSLKYPLVFGDKTRDVYLTGEAYFEVKKDHTKPFFVNTSGIHIKVLGTSFNVKSYPEEKTVETTLITGSVEIFSDHDKAEKTAHLFLKPSQKATYIKPSEAAKAADEKPASSKNLSEDSNRFQIANEIRPQHYISWKDNLLEFDNELFGDLCIKLERWYNVDITLNNDTLEKARFSGKFDKESVEQTFKALAEVMPFRYRIQKDKIYIY